MTQTQMILRHLQDHKSITTWDAFQEYGITRLSARIHDIKKKGYAITDILETTTNRYGETVNYKRYIIKLENKNGKENG